MDKKPSKKLKKTPLLTYKHIDLGEVAIPALDRAFDILFEEILRRRRSNIKKCPQKDIDS